MCNSRSFYRCAGCGIFLVVLLTAHGAAQEAKPLEPALKAGPSEGLVRLPTAYRRVTRTTRAPLAAKLRQALEAEGKMSEIDAATGDRIVHTLIDFLPEGWGRGTQADVPVDSLGRPIVNTAPGLPGWAQADVDALRGAIAEWIGARGQQVASGKDATETDGIIGNFVGQAIVRGIPYEDLIALNDPAAISEVTARSIISYLHSYESLKYVHAEEGRYTYESTKYPTQIHDLVTAHGASMEDVLRIEVTGLEILGGQPSGCYARTAFARGLTLLSGQTDIWVANGFDDVSADVPTGFPLFFFYDCQDTDNNDSVRVSTNGYISFFQQGGGATDGTAFSNNGIPDVLVPDGYAAPWWDDLVVATNQGNTDRVSYKTEGAVDSRVFTVEWFSISRLGGSANDFHFFQVKLFETLDSVELHFSTDWQADSIDDATTGMENYNGAGGDCGPNCLNTNNAPPPNDYRFTPVPRPDNDNCGNAIELINGASVTGNLHRATPDGNANCGSSSNNRDIWYTFVARCNGTLHADTCGSRDINGPDTGIDTVLSVHSGCPGTTANLLACNDDAGTASCNAIDSEVAVAMTAGQRVFIRVTHFGDSAIRFQSGAFRLNLNLVSTAAPANDNCASATPIAVGNTLIGNLLCASNDGSADCGSSTTNPDIWYEFTAPAAFGRLEASACGSRNSSGQDTGPDTVLAVHSGCPGTLANEIACNDDGFSPGCNTVDSRALAALSPGQNVKIRVSHFGSNAFRVGNGTTVLHVVYCKVDPNCDGQTDGRDVGPFLLALLNPAAYAAAFPGCDPCHCDLNADDLVTLADLDPFVQALLGP